MLRAAEIAVPLDSDISMNISNLDIEVVKVDYDIANDIPIEMLKS